MMARLIQYREVQALPYAVYSNIECRTHRASSSSVGAIERTYPPPI